MPREKSHLRREPRRERRSKRRREVAGEGPVQDPPRNRIGLPGIAPRLRARIHPTRHQVLRFLEAGVVRVNGPKQRERDQLRMVVPLVAPEPRSRGTGPIAAVTAKSEILDSALAPEIGHISKTAWIGATKAVLPSQRKPPLSLEPGPARRTECVEPKSR